MKLRQLTQPLLTRGHVVPLIAVFAAVTCSQHDQQSFTGTQRAAALAASTAWHNERGGFAVLTDYAFNDAIGSGGGVRLSGGWAIANPNGYVTELTNRTDAPLSPPNVGQWAYPVGYVAGDAPGTMYFDHAAVKEVYAGVWWEPSNPWQGHASGANGIAVHMCAGHRTLGRRGAGGQAQERRRRGAAVGGERWGGTDPDPGDARGAFATRAPLTTYAGAFWNLLRYAPVRAHC